MSHLPFGGQKEGRQAFLLEMGLRSFAMGTLAQHFGLPTYPVSLQKPEERLPLPSCSASCRLLVTATDS